MEYSFKAMTLDLLWHRVVVPTRIPSMGQIDLFKKLFVFDRFVCKKIS